MSAEGNKVKVRQIIVEIWNGGNMAVLADLVDPNCVLHALRMTFTAAAGITRAVNSHMRQQYTVVRSCVEPASSQTTTSIQSSPWLGRPEVRQSHRHHALADRSQRTRHWGEH